ncbi:MAG TPA: extracellular solute-binding protein [Acidimicrobiales bacterium]|nr:extracellular solute-binding protein [Acidimicrobiales bacterium]
MASTTGKDQSNFTILLTTEDTQTPQELEVLAKGACAAEEKAQPISLQTTPSQNMEAKVQLLASENALPFMYAANPGDVEPGGSLYKRGDVLNIAAALQHLGVANDMTSIALSTTKAQFGGTVPSVPFQMNIEGIFYNKKIFAEHGITVPTTWTALLADAAKLKAAGVTPISASGSSGWTISRWIGVLLFRELGANAMRAIADKQAKLTDSDYLWAAEQVALMGKDGYFSTGITNLSYNAATQQFLTGGSAMMYMGTWLLAGINSSENTQGNNIGFFPFPAVAGGKGSIGQYPANTGSANNLNAHLYGPHAAAWLKCIAQNYGSASLKDQGTFSGFRTNSPVSGLTPITTSIQKIINTAKGSVLWFEALFGLKANADASGNAAALVTGAMSAQQYMSVLQADQSQP